MVCKNCKDLALVRYHKFEVRKYYRSKRAVGCELIQFSIDYNNYCKQHRLHMCYLHK